MSKRPAIIVDLDGTLVDVSKAPDLVIPQDKLKRNKFKHTRQINSPTKNWVVDYVRELYYKGNDILIVTARDEEWAGETNGWLRANAVPYTALFMRKHNDDRKDYKCKEDILKYIYKQGWKPMLAIDDNPDTIELWKDYDIDVVKVPGFKS